MRESLVCRNSKVDAATTYKKFGSDTCNDSDTYEQGHCTIDAELRLLFLFLLLFLRVRAGVSITCGIGGFNIRLRRICSPVKYLMHTEDTLSRWRHDTFSIYSVLGALLFRSVIRINVCMCPKLEEY